MYICEKCGEVFVDCDFIDEPRPYGMGVVYEKFSCCPECKSMDIEEAVKCKICDEWHSELNTENGVCEKCINEVMSNFYKLIQENFDEEERDIIADNIDVNVL